MLTYANSQLNTEKEILHAKNGSGFNTHTE